MDTGATRGVFPSELPSTDVTILEGHTHKVSSCAWSPSCSLLASGSQDSTARIWTIPFGPCGSMMHNGPLSVQVLNHRKVRTNEEHKKVTALDWNVDGTLLATASDDGQARIWSRDGELKTTLNKHEDAIFSLKWNNKGDYLLSGSSDGTVIVWDVETGEWIQKYTHFAPILDVDWQNNIMFATCSMDNPISLCKIGESQPVKVFDEHQADVNGISWDPTGSLLASCSSDWTVKIWNLMQDKYLHDLKGHIDEIYTVRWTRTGPSTSNPSQQLVLASASDDSTVKLWDPQQGTLLRSLNAHRDSVRSIAFSPNGKYLASGSWDKKLHIWLVKEGKLVRTYAGNGKVFKACWNRGGDKIAAYCDDSEVVYVIDFMT